MHIAATNQAIPYNSQSASKGPSGTLSLSHCSKLRISGESVVNHQRPVSSKYQACIFATKNLAIPYNSQSADKGHQERYRCLTAQSSESAGKALQIISDPFHPSAKHACCRKEPSNSVQFTVSKQRAIRNAIVVSLLKAQNQRGKRCKSSATRFIQVPSMHIAAKNQAIPYNSQSANKGRSGTLSLSHCSKLRISGESVVNHQRPVLSRYQACILPQRTNQFRTIHSQQTKGHQERYHCLTAHVQHQ